MLEKSRLSYERVVREGPSKDRLKSVPLGAIDQLLALEDEDKLGEGDLALGSPNCSVNASGR
ncbi:MAG: hypothetical protein ACI8W8_004334 [Rhodothermales bacterium]|jgi:hypothetical protein